jgi:hypothetical protein
MDVFLRWQCTKLKCCVHTWDQFPTLHFQHGAASHCLLSSGRTRWRHFSSGMDMLRVVEMRAWQLRVRVCTPPRPQVTLHSDHSPNDHLHAETRSIIIVDYSKTCEIRAPLGRSNSVPNWEVFSFHRAVSAESSIWDQMRCPYFTGCPYFAGLLLTSFIVYFVGKMNTQLLPFKSLCGVIIMYYLV